MKTCTKCKIEKEVTEFNKQRKTKDGLKTQCRFCDKEYSKEYYKNNKEKVKECNKQYSKTNKERIKAIHKEYRENNKERAKEYRENNKERSKEYHKQYSKTNKKRINELRRERKKVDPLFKMSSNLRNRTSSAFKNKGYSKNTKTQEMLGVDWEVCKAHIERQFTKGMKWSNQGEWHIDHIIPLASAKTEEGLKKLCHYSNLQPLWAEDNLIKSDKLIGQQNKLRL